MKVTSEFQVFLDVSSCVIFHKMRDVCCVLDRPVWLLDPRSITVARCSHAWVEQGLTAHWTHYRSYRGRVFTGQMTQPTVSESTEGSSSPKDRLQSYQVHLTMLQAYTCMQYIHKNESKRSEMGQWDKTQSVAAMLELQITMLHEICQLMYSNKSHWWHALITDEVL